jgi:hypothetical protein
MISQVQRSAAWGVRIFGRVQPRVCFEQAEGVFQVEAAQERLPAAVDIGCGGADRGAPQPHGFRVAVAGQVLDLQPDEGAIDDR